MYYSLLSFKVISFVYCPQASQLSVNFNISKLAYLLDSDDDIHSDFLVVSQCYQKLSFPRQLSSLKQLRLLGSLPCLIFVIRNGTENKPRGKGINLQQLRRITDKKMPGIVYSYYCLVHSFHHFIPFISYNNVNSIQGWKFQTTVVPCQSERSRE